MVAFRISCSHIAISLESVAVEYFWNELLAHRYQSRVGDSVDPHLHRGPPWYSMAAFGIRCSRISISLESVTLSIPIFTIVKVVENDRSGLRTLK